MFSQTVVRRSKFSIEPTSSNTERTLIYLLMFTNSAQRELVSICTQSIHNRNWLSLPYILALINVIPKSTVIPTNASAKFQISRIFSGYSGFFMCIHHSDCLMISISTTLKFSVQESRIYIWRKNLK